MPELPEVEIIRRSLEKHLLGRQVLDTEIRLPRQIKWPEPDVFTAMDVHFFTPIQHPADDKNTTTITTHFDYHSISSRLVKLDILGHVYAIKTVVEEVENDITEVSLAEARQLKADYEVGDILEVEVTPANFGRIAAQTAKQVVVQRIREAERGIIYDEFANRESDIITGIVQRIENKNVFIDLGKTEAVLAPSEQIQGEEYAHGDRIKAYIIEVKKTSKGPQILVSRTHPGLLKRLFELEVPEIHGRGRNLHYGREQGSQGRPGSKGRCGS